MLGSPNRLAERISRLATDGLGWTLIAAIAMLCVAMMATVWWYYDSARLEHADESQRTVLAVTLSKSLQIQNWRSERLGDGRVLMDSHAAETAKRILERGKHTAERQEVRNRVASMVREFGYSDVALVTVDGRIELRYNEAAQSEAEFRQTERQRCVQAALQARDTILTDLTNDTLDGAPRMAVVVPIGQLGAFILEIDPARFLYPYLDTWPGSSATGECNLMRLDGNEVVYLNQSRHQPGFMPFFHRTLEFRLPPASVLDAGLILSGPDFRGHQVYAALRQIKVSPWYLLSKIDVDEVDRPIQRLGVEAGLLIAFIGLAGVALVGLIWVRHRSTMHREKEKWFRTAANESPVYLWMMSPAGEITFLNTPLQRFLGVDADFAGYWRWRDTLHPEDLARAEASVLEAVAKREGHLNEYRLRRFDGVYRNVVAESSPRLGPNRQLLGFAGVITDITERKEAEARSEAATARLQREVTEHKRTAREVGLLSARLMTAREDERKHLAGELHDDVNQQVAAVSIAMGNLKRQIEAHPEQARRQTDVIQQEIVRISETIHRISHELHPAVLEYRGLIPALRSACETFGALTSIRVSFVASADLENLPESTSLAVYRVAQEALQNIAKHARTKTADVEITRDDEALRLTISDGGVGMPAAEDRKQGLGLTSIRERIRLAGGTLEINSAQGRGTVLTVRIPFKE